eukprot:TRINITY_DN69069_c0_g1_i1.p1 TRINITY_DN69069_c0_g1~~TRINITY_DN69069_c0_g1_i1.p1  ORF type:complete len:440 (-),score=69.12 TRINITY_DN69069_c0_g1_i1:75-1343(-)
MADLDVDIYGDLCVDLPMSSPVQTLALCNVQSGNDSLGGQGPPSAPAAYGSAEKAVVDDYGGASWASEDHKGWNLSQGLVVDGGEVISGSPPKRPWHSRGTESGRGTESVVDDRPKDFDSLQRELLADEGLALAIRVPDASAAQDEVGDDTSDSGAEGKDDAVGMGALAITLGEVRASESGSGQACYGGGLQPPPRRRQTVDANVAGGTGQTVRRWEASVFLGPPPPVPRQTGGAECLVLLGGLPWWLSDVELRRHGEVFGQVRSIRFLDFHRSGKSTGIAVICFCEREGAQRSAAPTNGLCNLTVWDAAGVPPPRLVRVSTELYERLRVGTLPWIEGGPCSDDLRSILMRQFDKSLVASSSKRRRAGNGNFGGPSPERVDEKPQPRREEGWAEKLKALKVNVNSRQGVADASIDPRRRPMQ